MALLAHIYFVLALLFAQITPQQWRADIDYFAQQAARIHPNLFHAMTQAQWQAGLDATKNANAQTREQQVIAVMRLAGLIQDAHNEVEFPCGEGTRTNYPLRLRWFPQGIVVEAAPRQYANIVGGTLEAIDDTPIDKVWNDLLPLVSHDAGNVEGGLQAHPTIYLTCSGILHGLGITQTADSATYTVRVGRSNVRAALKPAVSWLDVVRPLTIVPADDWTQAPARVPLWLSRRRQMFWYTYLPHERTLYAQINNVLNAPDESLAHFSSRLIAAITKYKPARFVLDLRRNTGGDNTLLRPLLTGLVQSPVNRSNALFVLTGPQTFSAAQNLCNRLQYYTDAIFIGQPTADNVNFYADAKPIVLPNSRIAINISHLYWQDSDPRDGRAALYPDVAVDPTLDDFLNGRDPALQEALTHTPETPLEERLRSAASSGFDRAYAEYQAYVRDPRHEYVHGLEARLNSLGYELLSEKAYAKAVAVLRINTVEHPESSNAWDSLGDAYSSAGLKNDAVAAYRYSLQIDPANRDASRSLQSLEP